MLKEGVLPASFRDPSGFVFARGGTLLRQINPLYQLHYEHFVSSGLYQTLIDERRLIPHTELDQEHAWTPSAYRVIRPQRVPFLSYPYEWCFSQLKDAALLTLDIAQKALERNMILKDASAYNVQFMHGRPIFIDTLSFEIYRPGQLWPAYRQFCQHFLGPLALAHYHGPSLLSALRNHLDGIPLSLSSTLLPGSSWWRFSLLAHIHLHARSETRFASSTPHAVRPASRRTLLGLYDSLEQAIRRLTWKPTGTAWSDYYQKTNYSDQAMAAKESLVRRYLGQCRPQTTWDLGANDGRFSRIAAELGSQVIAFDLDGGAVEKAYNHLRGQDLPILPLVMDLTNPSPGIGWENTERSGWLERGPADAILALALVHHLALGHNLPFNKIFSLLRRLGRWLIIEFIPSHDSQAQSLLRHRPPIFSHYHQEGFERSAGDYFRVVERHPLPDSQRLLYLMEALP